MFIKSAACAAFDLMRSRILVSIRQPRSHPDDLISYKYTVRPPTTKMELILGFLFSNWLHMQAMHLRSMSKRKSLRLSKIKIPPSSSFSYEKQKSVGFYSIYAHLCFQAEQVTQVSKGRVNADWTFLYGRSKTSNSLKRENGQRDRWLTDLFIWCSQKTACALIESDKQSDAQLK